MAIRITCASCGFQGQVPDKVAGHKVKCKCGAVLVVPGTAAPPAPARTTGLGPKNASAGGQGTPPASAAAGPASDQDWHAIVAPDSNRRRRKTRGLGAKIVMAVLLIGLAAGAGAGFVYKDEVLSWIGVEKPAGTPASPLVAKGPDPLPVPTTPVEGTKPKTTPEKATPALVEKTSPALPVVSPPPREEKVKPIILSEEPPPLKIEKTEPKVIPGPPPTKVDKTEPKTTPDPAPAKVEKPKPKTAPEGPVSADVIFKKASPAVVRIIAHGTLDYEGSGFFVSPDGIVATNHHMIKDASTATIVVGDEGRYKVEGIIAMDVPADLVLLKVSGKGLPTLELGDAELPRVGSKAYAIGNPQGLANTLSDGLVSGHRDMGNGVTFIQTTAPISPGSSGGPLLSAEGKVIGIAAASFTGGQNLNLAVPVARLMKLLDERGALRPLPGPNSAVSLRWHLKLGDAFYIDFAESRLHQLKSKGLDWPLMQTLHTLVSRVKVTEINDEGILLEMHIEKCTLKLPEGLPQVPAKALGKINGATFTVTLSRQHSVVKFDGLEELFKQLIDDGAPESQRAFRETLNQMLRETFQFGPSVGTAMTGDSWQYTTTYGLSSVGSFQITRSYACEGRTAEGTRIAIKEDYKYRLPKGKTADDFGLRITAGNPKVEESKGVLIFDPKARRLVRTDFNTRVAGQLQGSLQNVATNLDLLIETRTAIRVFDRLPEAPKAPEK